MIQHNLKFPREFSSVGPVERIVLHHVAGTMTVEEIHDYHCRLGWNGIAYHYYIDKDGSVHIGRPSWAQGAGVEGMNYGSIHVVFNGNLDKEQLTSAAYKAGVALVVELMGMYPNADVVGHRELTATACPGKFFPLSVFHRLAAGKRAYDDIMLYTQQLPTDEWARFSCMRGITSGIFKDGDHDGLVDYPKAPISRQEVAVLFDRLGFFNGGDDKE